MWGGGQVHLCEKHGTIGCGQCGEVVNCNVVETCFHMWSMWGDGQIHQYGKHGTIGCGQCGEVANCNFVENVFSLVVNVGRWPNYIFVENMVQ